jgi:hypothetical protein
VDKTIEAITKEAEEIIRIIVETIIEGIISVASIIITEVVVGSINEADSEEATTDIRTRRGGSNSKTSLINRTTLLPL